MVFARALKSHLFLRTTLVLITCFILAENTHGGTCDVFYTAPKINVRVIEAKPHTNFNFAYDIGSKMQITDANGITHDVVLLGRLFRHDSTANIAFFKPGEPSEMLVYPESVIGSFTASDGTPVKLDSIRPQIETLRQIQPNCIGYACFNALTLLKHSHLDMFPELERRFADVNLRSEELVAIVDYLFVETGRRPHTSDILNFLRTYLPPLGLKLYYPFGKVPFEQGKQNLIESVKNGWPAIATFQTERYEPSYQVVIHDSTGKRVTTQAPSFVMPAAENSAFRHAVLISGYVEINGSGFFIVSDSQTRDVSRTGPKNGVPILWPASKLTPKQADAGLEVWLISQ